MTRPPLREVREVKKVAIIGAGPAGLTAALAGLRLGVDVTVFERAENFKRVGGGLVLQSNGHRVLEALGLLEAFWPLARCFKAGTIELVSNGRRLTADYRTLGIPHAVLSVVMRYQLMEFLEAAARRAGVDVRMGVECTGVVQDGNAVWVERATGESLRFDVVLACDGLRSRVRECLGVRARLRSSGEGALRGVAPVSVGRDEVLELWGEDGRRFGYAPLPGARTYFYATLPATAAADAANHIERLRSNASHFGRDAVEIVSSVEDWSSVNYDELREVHVERWHRGSVFILGDAAHAMTPNVGQGANAAMVDGLVLMQLIARALAEKGTLDEVGREFERVRRRFVTKTQAMAWRWGEMAKWTSPLARSFRAGLFRLMAPRAGMMRSALLTSAGYNPAEEGYFNGLR